MQLLNRKRASVVLPSFELRHVNGKERLKLRKATCCNFSENSAQKSAELTRQDKRK